MAPSTSYILDALTDLYIQNSDPSTINKKDPVLGLQQKEKDLSLLTHESLAAAIPDYDLMESKVALTIGSKLSKILCGVETSSTLVSVPPTISFSSFYLGGNSSSSSSSSSPDTNIYIGKDYLLETIISGGNMAFDGFNYNWILTSSPTPGDIEISEISNDIFSNYWHILTQIRFIDPGFYSIQLKLTHKIYPTLSVIQSVNVSVVS